MPGEPNHLETLAAHRLTQVLVAVAIGLALTFYAFQLTTDPRSVEQRAEEEAMVHAARGILNLYVASDAPLEIVDPLTPRRAIGKVYIYPVDDGFEVSGYYRRGEQDTWHPFLMKLDAASRLLRLSVRDPDAALQRLAAEDPRLVVRQAR
jgi:hypothetical protein